MSAVKATPNSAASLTSRRRNKNVADDNLVKKIVHVMKSSQDRRKNRTITDMDENDFFFKLVNN